jgi:glycyl-tRNA synthetase beta chain
MEPFRTAASKDAARAGNRIHRYLLERLYTFAWPAPASATGGPGPQPVPAPDCIDAVLASPCDNLIDAMDRIASLQRLTGHPGLRKAAKVIERTRNILRGAPLRQPQVDPSRLAEPPERKLWDVYASNHEQVARLAAERSYAEATTLFGELFFEPLHQFFDQVLVNVPDEPLQQNRLALMQAIHTLYTDRIADLSKLTLLQREEPPGP